MIFWFLIITFNLCFYYQLWVKWLCIHIGNNSGHIGQTLIRFPKCLWIFNTEWNAHEIGILIICSINDNLTNTSSTLPPEVKIKKTVPYIVNLILLCTSTETLFTGTLRIKSLTYFRHQIDITVVLLFCGSFFRVLTSVLCKWNI